MQRRKITLEKKSENSVADGTQERKRYSPESGSENGTGDLLLAIYKKVFAIHFRTQHSSSTGKNHKISEFRRLP